MYICIWRVISSHLSGRPLLEVYLFRSSIEIDFGQIGLELEHLQVYLQSSLALLDEILLSLFVIGSIGLLVQVLDDFAKVVGFSALINHIVDFAFDFKSTMPEATKTAVDDLPTASTIGSRSKSGCSGGHRRASLACTLNPSDNEIHDHADDGGSSSTQLIVEDDGSIFLKISPKADLYQ
jgi:hypothetical protein